MAVDALKEVLVNDPVVSAEMAGLEYTNDYTPGIIRKKVGKGFVYKMPEGQTVKDGKTLKRIKSLVIPPAWTEVWICTNSRGHLQATGRDAKGRKQYRYHPEWRKVRDETKYDKMVAFGYALPIIRERIQKDISVPGLSKNKVLAAVVNLLEKTLIRIGNEEYAKTNQSYGLTTMKDRHAAVEQGSVYFKFTGKSKVKHLIKLKDKQLSKIIKQCQEIPGQELFQYIGEDGNHYPVTSSDVNAYLKEITGENFTAKDFRTWYGTVLASEALKEFEKYDTQAQAKKNIVQAIESVSKQLGNTKSICRKCYVHPAILDSYMDGSLLTQVQGELKEMLAHDLHNLKPEEAAVIALLEKRLEEKLTT
jgi:DNA topoisomerase-1